MTDVNNEVLHEDARTVRISRWEFNGLVVQSFLLIGCLSALLGLSRPGSGGLSKGVVVAAVTLLVPLALFPIISIAARVYYHTDIGGGNTLLWFVMIAAALTIIVFVVHW